MLALQNTWTNYLKYGKRIFYKKKSVIFQQGEIGSGFYYIYKGTVKIISFTPGEGKRILDVVGPGVLSGWIDHSPYFCSAVCHEDSVVYYFSQEDYENVIQKHPEVTFLYAEAIVSKEKLLLNSINVTSTSTESQIAYSLLYLIHSCRSKVVNLSQQDLSHFVGFTRITVYKVLKKWASDGIIRIQNRKIYVTDMESLESVASGKLGFTTTTSLQATPL